MQEEDYILHIVAYAYHKLNKAEKNYAITERTNKKNET